MGNKVVCSFTLDPMWYEKIKQLADSEGRSNSGALNHILRERFGGSA